MDERSAYRTRLAKEQNIYRDCLDIHRLPDIFHYWSNRYVRPKLEAFGFSSPNELFRCSLMDHCRRPDPEPRRFVSIGSGNCDLEIGIAAALQSGGSTNFVIDCLELNTAMLERGRTAADQAGLGGQLNFLEVDLNEWTAAHQYDAVIANQILHHVLDLEHLLAQIKVCLKPHGTFVISDSAITSATTITGVSFNFGTGPDTVLSGVACTPGTPGCVRGGGGGIPEPGTIALLGSALVGFGLLRRRKPL